MAGNAVAKEEAGRFWAALIRLMDERGVQAKEIADAMGYDQAGPVYAMRNEGREPGVGLFLAMHNRGSEAMREELRALLGSEVKAADAKGGLIDEAGGKFDRVVLRATAEALALLGEAQAIEGGFGGEDWRRPLDGAARREFLRVQPGMVKRMKAVRDLIDAAGWMLDRRLEACLGRRKALRLADDDADGEGGTETPLEA